MTPEQQKLIKLLAEIGDVTIIKRSVETLIEAISQMDSDALELILEDNVSYQDTTKTIFLKKLKEVFVNFQKTDDKLIPNKGKCNSEECPNKNKNGVAFIGNKSGSYLNLIIEQDDKNAVTDIYHCYDFCIKDKEIDEYKRQYKISVFNDEKIKFNPSSEYTYLNNKSLKALNQLNQLNDQEIYLDEFISWLEEFRDLFNSMDWLNQFYKNQKSFYDCYKHMNLIHEFLIIEDEAKFAIKKYNSINHEIELQLLKWLVRFEDLNFSLIQLYPDVVSKESIKTGKIYLYKEFTVYIKIDKLKNCIDLQEIISKLYYDKLRKYTTQTAEEQENQIPFDDDYEMMSSLKYHLKKRGII